MKITGVSGSLGSPSKTKALVAAIVHQLETRLRTQGQVLDLAETAHQVWSGGFGKATPAAVKDVLERIEASDVLVVGTPVYKGSYSGLFKHVFDLVDRDALRDKTVLIAATGGSDQHALVLEHHLRPLFSFFGAYIVPTGVYAKDSDFADHATIANPDILQRIAQAAEQASDLAGRLAPAAAAA